MTVEKNTKNLDSCCNYLISIPDPASIASRKRIGQFYSNAETKSVHRLRIECT